MYKREWIWDWIFNGILIFLPPFWSHQNMEDRVPLSCPFTSSRKVWNIWMPLMWFTFSCSFYWKKLGRCVRVGQIKEGTLNFARLCDAVIQCVSKMPEHVSSPGRRWISQWSKVNATPLWFSPSARSGGRQSGFVERAQTSLNAKFYIGVLVGKCLFDRTTFPWSFSMQV